MPLTAYADGAVFGDAVGSRPARVIALHGWGRTRADFAALLEGLDAVAVDLPGFGASPAPPAVWGAADYAAALDPVLAAAARPAVLVGHSRGGCVAVEMAARHPEAVGALVLTGAPLVRRTPAGGGRAPARYRLGRWLHRRHLLSDARMEALRQRHGSADYRAASGLMRDVLVRMVNETHEDALRQVRCAVELVWGDDDADVPLEVAQRAAELLADARLTVVPGAGHDTVRTAVPALRAAIERHLPPDALG
ncbi:MAG: alpha/beta fold hydrolase [Acidimicrobiales bacterium]|nr:alpha/beta fold hydrolase [Acidimicrobiales bacterium]